MSTLKTNIIDTTTGTTITIPTGKVLTVTDNSGISIAGTAVGQAIEKVDKLIDKVTDGSMNYNQWKYAINKINTEFKQASMPELQIKHLTEKEIQDSLGTLTAVDLLDWDAWLEIPF